MSLFRSELQTPKSMVEDVYPHEDIYEDLDANTRYELGLATADDLFDAYPQDDTYENLDYGVTSKTEKDFTDYYLLPPSETLEEACTKESDKALREMFRFATWFARESMGLHKKHKTEDEWTKSHYGREYLHNYSSANASYGERLQAALLGIFKASKKYNNEGARFSTYAMYYMENELQRCTTRTAQDYQVYIPLYEMDTLNKVKAANVRSAEQGRAPNLDEAVYEVGTSPEKIKQAAVTIGRFATISLDEIDELCNEISIADVDDDEEQITVADRLRKTSDTEYFDDMINDLYTATIVRLFDRLDERSQQILELRSGLDGTDMAKTLAEVGKFFDISRERIRQIEAKALSEVRMRAHSRGYSQDVFGIYDTLTGIRYESLGLSEMEQRALGLSDLIVFDETPSDKYRKVYPGSRHYAPEWDW